MAFAYLATVVRVGSFCPASSFATLACKRPIFFATSAWVFPAVTRAFRNISANRLVAISGLTSRWTPSSGSVGGRGIAPLYPLGRPLLKHLGQKAQPDDERVFYDHFFGPRRSAGAFGQLHDRKNLGSLSWGRRHEPAGHRSRNHT